MGGIWERMIRSVRRVFNSVIRHVLLDDSELSMVMCEVECVINNRPITPVSDDKDDDAALTPSHLLNLGVTGTPPPVIANKTDRYRRRWRFLQMLVDRFWQRWSREYLPMIQLRQKWIADARTVCVGDVVLLVDDVKHRNDWPLARVVAVHHGRDCAVRSCTLRLDGKDYRRPVNKLCLLEACDA